MQTIIEAIKEKWGKYPVKKNRLWHIPQRVCEICEEKITKNDMYYENFDDRQYAHEECVNPNII